MSQYTEGVNLIGEERNKQIEKHGFTAEHHAQHPEWYDERQLLSAATMLSGYDADDGLTYLYRDIVPVN